MVRPRILFSFARSYMKMGTEFLPTDASLTGWEEFAHMPGWMHSYGMLHEWCGIFYRAWHS